ncbi:MAG: hypothetical protein DWQ06_07415 [Calditrichaeota bacterium]|nr:MAG: hypothetical protein DWQ06_07415 [Calditrichota bacterium]
MKLTILIALLLTVNLALGQAKDYKLNGEVRKVFREEMSKIDSTFQEMNHHLVRGNLISYRNCVRKIKEGFVLKSKLTIEQHKEIDSKLSKRYKSYASKFERHLRKLSSAAKKRDLELINFYHGKVLEDCTSCHKNVVSEKFPNFKSKKKSTSKKKGQK